MTKVHENFGFIDEDVIFQASVVKGTAPQVGDRVLVEASYNGSMPFKWNATRVQVIAPPVAQQQQQQLPPQKLLSSTAFNQNGNIVFTIFVMSIIYLILYRHDKANESRLVHPGTPDR